MRIDKETIKIFFTSWILFSPILIIVITLQSYVQLLQENELELKTIIDTSIATGVITGLFIPPLLFCVAWIVFYVMDKFDL